jgi:hypothetical protein
MQTCNGVKLATKKKMKDGDREWTIPSFTYYAGHKHGQLQTTTNHGIATPMTLELAERLTAKLNATGMQAEVCDLFADPETMLHETLVDIGEEAPPPAATPTSLAGLAKAIEDCFDQGFSPLEVLSHCNKVILGVGNTKRKSGSSWG